STPSPHVPIRPHRALGRPAVPGSARPGRRAPEPRPRRPRPPVERCPPYRLLFSVRTPSGASGSTLDLPTSCAVSSRPEVCCDHTLLRAEEEPTVTDHRKASPFVVSALTRSTMRSCSLEGVRQRIASLS